MWRYPNGAGWVDSSQLSSVAPHSLLTYGILIAQVVQIVAILNAAGFYYKPDRNARVTIFYSVSCPDVLGMINSATVLVPIFWGGEAVPDVVPW
jgi:hypothetical protein